MPAFPPNTDAEQSPAPDTILYGGTIHCLDAGLRQVSALAIGSGTITALGTDEEILALAGPGSRRIDLSGQCVLPGINDSHLHGVWLGARWPALMLESPGEDWHGRLLSGPEDRRRAILACFRLLASLGITSYTEPGIGPGEDAGETGCFGSDVLAAYAALAGTSAQTARVTLLSLHGLLDGASTLSAFEAGLSLPKPAADPRWLSIPGVKIFADGIPPLRTAWVEKPYLDGSVGTLFTGEGDLSERAATYERMIRLGHAAGEQVAVHATGDRTVEMLLSTVEALGGAGRLRHYAIHGDLVTPEQLARMAKAGVGLTVQPVIAAMTGEWMAGALRPEQIARAFPIDRIFGTTGLRATLSSDAPVATPDWRRIVATAAGQLDGRGLPVGRAELSALLRMMTAIPAEQDGAEDWKGTLEVGKVADLCVLSQDPLEAGWQRLPEIAVERTMVDGRFVYDRTAATGEAP